MTKLPLIINFVLFQTVWFLSLFLEAQSVLYTSGIVVLMFVLSKQHKLDALLLVKALPIALLCEYLAVQLNLLEFKVSPFPLWLALLWAALLLCLNTSMAFITNLKLWQAYLVCLAFAPISYYSGAQFGVLSIYSPVWAFWLLYGALWAAAFTLILIINQKIKAIINCSKQ
ncbi:DUF2878 domain-containing protein [Pseudoalteromonas agarivorans]|uniref:DUF2878 domain-containing protein n=1 Tax=Pseudoalteromonas TaxID=53246 RepID=UPI0006D664F0|nr:MULTISPECIES: DUF2878 domain-containing protein [Pseudoalteromonas]AZN34411.1 DUF2878 domain-containing protein [Pseudoalteromonas sp. Xi13]KPZ62983.1 hypothetical protein AN389_00220 [Pseudoalteromonas sp. P1-7a]MCQ8820491.1 DUF2878 domain-containing protein [Pseudoalteromonas agarivorans]MCQ8886828.1 DUF2878 domain-containing protein [Pseudoalteromonas agarivorans]